MKELKVSLVIMAAALLTVGLSGMAYAFHSGGVAECEGCHSMHSPAPGGSYLLIGADKSSTCLSCHEHAGDTGPSSYHISTASADLGAGIAPLQRTPGGDFGWLRKNYPVGTDTEDGALHGHNIIATEKSYVEDTRHPGNVSPGGSYPTGNLGCASCHDPHGKARRLSDGTYATTGAPIIGSGSTGTIPAAGTAVGVYRILRSPLATELAIGFTPPTFGGYPIAVAPSSYNRKENATQTRVAYGATGTNTWGNWCSTCHASMHSSGNYVHPVDQNLGSTVAGLYNSYVKSGDLTGSNSTAYLSLVPFAENTGDIATLASHAKTDDSALTGPATADKVMCLSCHRAHASGTLHALRFDQGYEFMTVNNNYLGSDNPSMTSTRAPLQHRGRTMAEWQAHFYDRPASKWASYQRALCNKCHAKD